MDYVNFLNNTEKELESILDGNIFIVKFHDIVKGWSVKSKTDLKSLLLEKIDKDKKLYIVYDENEYVYKEMIDLLNIIKKDYSEMLKNEMVYLVNLNGFDGSIESKNNLKINLLYK